MIDMLLWKTGIGSWTE